MPIKPSVIGICGKKFNGKDTIADYLVENYGYTKISLGDALKRGLKEIFGFTNEQLWGNKKEEIDTYWKVTPREIMQYIGTDCLRIKIGTDFPHIGNNLWIMALEKNIASLIEQGITNIVIPDLRFPNEEKIVKKFNGIIIRVVRPSIKMNDDHISENSFEEITCDYTLENNTLEQLHTDIDDLICYL